MELGGVGRGWALVAGTLLAATAAKLSRPEVLGISRAEVAMAAISIARWADTFLCRSATGN